MTGAEGNTQFAYARIREAIVEGRYAPASRLVEQRIAEELQLSRTPVREALKMLEAEGLVVIERNVGALVRSMDRDTVVDLYELRARLESYAAFRAATRRTDEQLARMGGAIDDFEDAMLSAAALEVAGIRVINRCNSTIHSTIVQAAHHDRLANMLSRTVDVPLVFEAFRRFDHSQLQRSNSFHRLIFEAIGVGDAVRAERLMTEHIDQGRDVLLAAIVESSSGLQLLPVASGR